ncbi:GntR family transcriptional regulator [bacterium]|nr:MAG: GntR family transcriptional regulator [bacterium]
MPRVERLFQYQEIARELRQEILRGDFRHDGRLPSERSLGERFQVQRNTVRQALALLESEGQISTEGKRGSFIRIPPVTVVKNAFLISLPGESSPDLVRLSEGFNQTADRAGIAVRKLDTHPEEGHPFDHVPDAERLSPDTGGVVLWPQNPTKDEKLIRLNAAVPLVLVDRRVLGVSADSVRFDDVAGGQMVTNHLLEQGHRRIAFLTDDVFAETVHHRWQGYATAMEEADVPVEPTHSHFFHGLHEPFFSTAIRLLLSQGKKSPTAIVCSNDIVAFTLLRFLRDEGIRVPDDVAVTGYGNTMPNYTEAMALTSVDQAFFELGRAAAGILLDRIGQSTPERLKETRNITIPVKLVVRKSSVSGPGTPLRSGGEGQG